MRMLGATDIGSGTVLSALCDGGESKAFLLDGGTITAYPLDGGKPTIAGYGRTYCDCGSATVRLKGEVPVYEQK